MPFAPGTSGNKNGRPRGAAGLARYCAEQTDGGTEMIDALLVMARDPKTPARERLAAVTALLDRAVGKPLQTSEISMAVGRLDLPIDTLMTLSPAERLRWLDGERVRRALAAGGAE